MGNMTLLSQNYLTSETSRIDVANLYYTGIYIKIVFYKMFLLLNLLLPFPLLHLLQHLVLEVLNK